MHGIRDSSGDAGGSTKPGRGLTIMFIIFQGRPNQTLHLQYRDSVLPTIQALFRKHTPDPVHTLHTSGSHVGH